ncbi:MAG: hypothetical protein Q4C50_10780 [Eubacteriales bacterium]|nr:hypothetical protein [Eubacteriales bacterium]
MKWNWKKIRRILCVLLIAFFYVQAWRFSGKMEKSKDTVLILMDANPVDAEQAKAMQEKEKEQETPREFVLWNQKNEVEIENENLKRTHTAAAVAVAGRSDLLMKGTARVDEEDKKGCLIDEHTAIKLFGNTNVTGLTVNVAGEEKVIRGLLFDAKDTVLYEAEGKEQKFTNLTVFTGDGAPYYEVRQDFMMRHELEGRFLRMDLLSWAARLLCLLIPLLAGGRILAAALGLAFRHRREQAGIWIALGGAACFGGLLWMLALKISLPSDMIPTKWSDFEFWGGLWENWRESFLLLLLTEKQRPIQAYVEAFSRTAGCCLAGIVSCFLF